MRIDFPSLVGAWCSNVLYSLFVFFSACLLIWKNYSSAAHARRSHFFQTSDGVMQFCVDTKHTNHLLGTRCWKVVRKERKQSWKYSINDVTFDSFSLDRCWIFVYTNSFSLSDRCCFAQKKYRFFQCVFEGFKVAVTTRKFPLNIPRRRKENLCIRCAASDFFVTINLLFIGASLNSRRMEMNNPLIFLLATAWIM